MERDVNAIADLADTQHFNSHAHVERDDTQALVCARVSISTHTLTWSVTHRHESHGYGSDISTHTLTWSVTVSNDVV